MEKGDTEGQVIQEKKKKIDVLLEFLLGREGCLVHAVLSCRLHTFTCAALKAKASGLSEMSNDIVNTEGTHILEISWTGPLQDVVGNDGFTNGKAQYTKAIV